MRQYYTLIISQGAKNYSIKMQDLIAIPPPLLSEDQEDLEALQLFEKLGAQSHSEKQPDNDLHPDYSDEEAPKLSRLSKMKKESKKDKKKRKIKQKNKMKKLKHKNRLSSPTSKKKIKREGSTKKKSDAEQHENNEHDDRGSSEFDSESADEDLNSQLKNLNPDYAEEEESPKKRLKKSGRKQKIQNRQGFRLQQLGNDPDANFQNRSVQSDDQYSGEAKKKKSNKRKSKVAVPSNAQIMNAFKENGVVQSQGEEAGDNRDYDRGFDTLHAIKKKAKDGIRVNNRLFGDLEMNLQNQEAQVQAPENFQLELRPKTSNSVSQRISFMSKAETIKKLRGLEAEVNNEQFDRKAVEKAKKSVAKLISSMASQQFHDDLELQIRVPTIARGKSSDIINNTVFLRSLVDKNTSEQPQDPTTFPLKQTHSFSYSSHPKKEIQSRQQFFKQIQEQTRMRRSKYISNEELKSSFKKTNLEELEETRKRIQEKKRKEALEEDQESEEEQLDSEMKEMIEKEQKVCGNIEQQEEEEDEQQLQEQENRSEKRPQFVDEQAVEEPDADEQAENQKVNRVANEELQQFNELMEELDNVEAQASKQQEQQQQEEEHQQNQFNQQEIQLHNQTEKHSAVNEKSQHHNSQVDDVNPEQEKQIRELEDEGIIVRKRKKITAQEHQQIEQNQQIAQQKYLIPEVSSVNIQHEQKQKSKQPVTNKIKPETGYQENEEFSNFRKLRKIAFVIAKKRKERQMGRQYASQFIQHEAQEGSDDEEHDDIIKNINYQEQAKQFQGMDLDADLVELIDNAVDINEQNQFQAFRKYLEDVRMRDREEIKKIVRGQFWKKHEDLQFEMEQDDKKRQERMQEMMNWMKQREQQEGEGIYLKQPEPEQKDSDQDSEFEPKKPEEKEEQQEESQPIDPEEAMARLNRELEDIVPTIKKEFRPVSQSLNLLQLPESMKRDRSNTGQRTISMSKFGCKSQTQINPQNLINKKSTSSLVNQILNRTVFKQKKLVGNIFGKPTKKK